MAHGATSARYVTRLLPLYRLTKRQRAQCEALRREAGRCWATLVSAHKESRERGQWLSARALELLVARGYALHSQTVQALAQRLDANVQTARAARCDPGTSGATIAYPYRTPEYQTVIWKDMAIHNHGDALSLSNGRGREPLRISLPAEYLDADIRRAELIWRADHFELCLTLAVRAELPMASAGGAVAGVDLGEVHIAAIATSTGNALVVSGRHLRSCKRLRNKRHAAYQQRLARCTPGSRRRRRLRRRRAQASARFHRQQRDILHQASRNVVDFCRMERVSRMAVGDVRDAHDRVRLGKRLNQKIGQWAHGQLTGYLEYKARAVGMPTHLIPEDYSTRTCSHCGSRSESQQRGRRFACEACGARLHRDANGAANICSRAVFATYGRTQIAHVRHVRPIVTRRCMPTRA